MAPAPILICRAPGCGRQFRGHIGPGAQPGYCDDVCRALARVKHREAECARCGERFVLAPHTRGRPTIYCSDECRYATIHTLECTICGRSFDRKNPTGRLPKTCSDPCRAEAARRRASAARAADGRPRPPRSAPRSARRASLPVLPSETPAELMAEIDEWFAAG